MFNAAFAIVMAAGVAIAWRSNPMYSLGKTIRFLALCALALAIYVGAILGVLDVTASLDKTTSGIALGLTILIGTMFYIWVIVTASTPRPPPPSWSRPRGRPDAPGSGSAHPGRERNRSGSGWFP